MKIIINQNGSVVIETDGEIVPADNKALELQHVKGSPYGRLDKTAKEILDAVHDGRPVYLVYRSEQHSYADYRLLTHITIYDTPDPNGYFFQFGPDGVQYECVAIEDFPNENPD